MVFNRKQNHDAFLYDEKNKTCPYSPDFFLIGHADKHQRTQTIPSAIKTIFNSKI